MSNDNSKPLPFRPLTGTVQAHPVQDVQKTPSPFPSSVPKFLSPPSLQHQVPLASRYLNPLITNTWQKKSMRTLSHIHTLPQCLYIVCTVCLEHFFDLMRKQLTGTVGGQGSSPSPCVWVPRLIHSFGVNCFPRFISARSICKKYYTSVNGFLNNHRKIC